MFVANAGPNYAAHQPTLCVNSNCWLTAEIINAADNPAYSRGEFRFKTYEYGNHEVGFYTGQINSEVCKLTVDHVVSLRDAFDSGAKYFTKEKKRAFANDVLNHVPACARINSSKSSLTPYQWLSRSTDGRGVEVVWPKDKICDYIRRYYLVKQKWSLSFHNNDKPTFAKCGLSVE